MNIQFPAVRQNQIVSFQTFVIINVIRIEIISFWKIN